MNNKLGLYLHVPFCGSKCAYCDFYSYRADVAVFDRYTDTLCNHIKLASERIKRPVDTVYFGGGTPSLLGGERISKLTSTAKDAFLIGDAEITVEANPADDLSVDFELMAEHGVNRISLGVQSGIESELLALSRRHTNADVIRTVQDIKNAGIHNISLDLMLGIPHQTMDSLKQSLDFILEQDPTHVSCYILKIEPNTPFGRSDTSMLDLPDDDLVADMYLFVSDYLKENGFEHYEVSNFAKPGFRSQHNTRYWLCDEYLGLGPSAHSFINRKRFHFDCNTEQYLSCPSPVFDRDGGEFEEYCMLKLRLSDGLDLNEVSDIFGSAKADWIKCNTKKFIGTDLLTIKNNKISLTVKGFLLSNSIISELIF